MKLSTCLQLSAIFPIMFAIAVILLLQWRFGSLTGSSPVDIILKGGLGLLGITMAAVIISYSRQILGKIKILNEWIDAVLKGDLDPKVTLAAGNDEIGRLSDALSKMLRELKAVYRALEQDAARFKDEASQHKKGEQTSQMAMRHLADALSKLRESQRDVVYKERMHVLEQVVRGVTHDLSDAMTPILGISELLLAYPEQLEQKDALRAQIVTVHEAAERASNTLKNLAGFYHTTEESAGPTDVNAVIKKGVELTRPRWKAEAQASGVDLRLGTDLVAVPAAAVDEGELRDVVIGLILNAVEAMPNGGVLTLSSRAEKNSISLLVSDTGKGMNPDVLRCCLEPFYSTKKGAGRGMGLTIANSVVRRYGGEINIESLPGKGTQVRLTLPLWANKPPAKIAAGEAKDSGGLRVMVVDDNPGSRDIVAAIFRINGHIAEVATSGLECLEKMKANAFDVAVIDRAMPEMGGDELATEIKKLKPGMPVIMLTGFGDVMIEEGNLPDNVDLILPKPMPAEELLRGLRKVLALKAEGAIHAAPGDSRDFKDAGSGVRKPGAKEKSDKAQTMNWMD